MGLTFDYLSSRGSTSLWIYSPDWNPVEARRNWHAPVFKISSCLPICGLSLVVRLLGMVLVADLKKIIAFSSVSHIGFSVLLTSFRTKPTGKILDLNRPCLSSSAMFLAVYYFYLYSNSRNLVIKIGITS